MANVFGTRSTTTDTGSQRRQVDDMLVTMSPKKVPLLKLLGITGFVGENPKYEWVEDTLLATSTTLNGAHNNTVTTINVAAGDGANFQKGTLFRAITSGGVSEYIWVSADPVTDALTVVRGVAGTTAQTFTGGETVEIIGLAYPENTDSPLAGTSQFNLPFNYFQLFDTAIQVSNRQNNTAVYGIRGRDYDFQVAKKLSELMIKLERNCFLGQRNAAAGGVPQLMGGFPTFITQNVTDLAGAALTEQSINDALQSAFYKVGDDLLGRTIICGAWAKRKISSFYAPTARMDRASRKGGVVVNTVDTEFGEVDVLMNIWCPKDQIFIINTDLLKVGHYKGGAFYDELLPASGGYVKGHLYGDYSLEMKGDKAHMLIKNVSQTA